MLFDNNNENNGQRLYFPEELYIPSWPEETSVEFHLRVEPDVKPMQMAKDLTRVCNLPRGGTVEQAYLYYDAVNAAAWCDIANQEDYFASFEGNQSLAWVAQAIKDHLKDTKFDKRVVDIVGIGSGDAKREGNLIQSLLDVDSALKVNCHLIDKSNPLLIAAHAHLDELFLHTGRVTVREFLADFWRLPYISELFDSEESEKRLRVACMFGYTFGNLDGELRFVRDSLRALKPGDLLLLDLMLGFAPHNNADAIRREDPRFIASQSNWKKGIESWLATTLKRHRSNCGNISFENVLVNRSSAFPDAYTLEIHAHVETAKQTARFNMLRLHRYSQEAFIGTMTAEGFRRVGGKTYGTQRGCLRYMFVKE